ncbi:MAG: HAD-IA family hydrolase [Acholeplasmataceae bacterium]|nr:HAD-IA family hydrolase [Acholeplasmataceae bacterium]
MIKTILFDLDGTLIQTTDIILDTLKLTFEKFFPEVTLSETELTDLLGQTIFKTFGHHTDSEEKINEVVAYYREVSDFKLETGLKAYPGALETMIYLKKKGCKIGVVTSKMRKIANDHLSRTHLIDWIDGLIGYEDVINHKPDPEPIGKALNLLGAKPNQTVYVGDHENDIMAAKKAGVLTCAVTYSHRLREMLSLQPDFVIDELNHLKDIV